MQQVHWGSSYNLKYQLHEPTGNGNIDWCEKNAVVSGQIMEFFNSMSSLVMVVLGIYGIFSLYCEYLQHKDIYVRLITHSPQQHEDMDKEAESSSTSSLMQETRAYIALTKESMIAAFFLALVGVGSFAFHATLNYESQLLDELPMIWGMTWLTFVITDHQYTLTGTVLLLAFTISHIRFHTAWLLPLGFGLSILTAAYHAHTNSAPHHLLRRFFWTGTIQTVLFGFLLWNIDSHACLQLREMRDVIQGGTRLSLDQGLVPIVRYLTTGLLEFHAWWHCLAGIGVYNLVILVHSLQKAKIMSRSHQQEKAWTNTS